MKQDKIRAVLPFIGSKYLGTRTGWVLCTCPMFWEHGGKRSDAFAVSVDAKKRSRVKCLSCGYHGDLRDVLLDVNFKLKKHPEFKERFQLGLAAPIINAEFEDVEVNIHDIPDYEEPPLKMEKLFPEQWLAGFPSVLKFPHALHYCLNKRGLTLQVLKDLDVRYDPKQERVCFPFRNFKGELMGVQGRYIGKMKCKDDPAFKGLDHDHPLVQMAPLRYLQYGYQGHRNPHIWMNEDKVNLDMPVVCTEGPFDLAKIFIVYPNVVCSFTTGMNKTKIKRIGDADSLITYYDHGHGGNAAREAIEKCLPNMPMTHIIPTEEEGDAGDMPVSVIRDSLKDYVELPKVP